MTINTICALLIDALKDAGYDDSTIFNYRGVIRRFKAFCEEQGFSDYLSEIGRSYAEDVISQKTGHFSKNRYHSQGRFFRLIDSFFQTGKFDFSSVARGKVTPDHDEHKAIYKDYGLYLRTTYENKNTIHFYEYGAYQLLQYLNGRGIINLDSLDSETVIHYIQDSKQERQREILCELRSIFKYLHRNDLLTAIAGIHAPRMKRIIPTLTDDEQDRIMTVIKTGRVTLRDAAIVLLGLSCGIRACDLIKLRLSDINWESEIISFRQRKTGNLVCLPITTVIGNALTRYIVEERPVTQHNFVFVRELAPFNPFIDHSSCYEVVRRVFRKAGINKDGRIFGMHMLRHNSASTMVRHAVPVETIAAILGHASPDATDIYITTDEAILKECVLPMAGISQEVNP
jgi:site-specific recombinase XerD